MAITSFLRAYKWHLKISFWVGSGLFIIGYHINRTYKTLSHVVNPNVLRSECKTVAEYIYIDDPAYEITLKQQSDKEKRKSLSDMLGFTRIWKNLQFSLTWKLLWLSRRGNKDQCTIALEHLAAFKNKEDWDCEKIAQALDKNTAVLLARTNGADLRYFLQPPLHIRRAALSTELLSQKFFDMLSTVQNIHPHNCVEHFLSKNLIDIQEQAQEDSIPCKPDSIYERDLCILCLDILHHHLTLFAKNRYEDDESIVSLINQGLLHRLAELILRNYNDPEIDWAVMRIITILSIHSNLLEAFFQSGLIGQLARLIKSKNLRLSSSAAVALANLSGEHSFRPGLYLLHPIYRTRKHPTCDIMLVHGLRGGVFVTWRQRDKDCDTHSVGFLEGTVIDNIDPVCENLGNRESVFIDPELKQVIEDLDELEEESLLSDYDVILHDLPTYVIREQKNTEYTCVNKRRALRTEEDDKCCHTYCWPKDWLPKDCKDLRVIGVNYWSTLSEWLEKCPWQTADIETRASQLTPDIVKAGVGNKDVPVVWLAHSMGGLIVKQVLIEAAKSKESDFKNLCQNTKAIIFFSVPHNGSALATMPKAARLILWPSVDVQQLEENSPSLLKLNQEFLKFADQFRWETISFTESKPTLLTAFKVPVQFVKATSADLGRGVLYQLPLDHLYICKPATRQSLLYTTIVDVIHRVSKQDHIHLSFTQKMLSEIFSWYLIRSDEKYFEKCEQN